MSWNTQNFIEQKRNFWPKSGKHILAQYDDDTVVVYQAYKPEIAKYAADNQRFGGIEFSFERMSWIKTNFLWMMYRCGWASKKHQERVLAVRITREGFEEILSKAWTGQKQKAAKVPASALEVRLQWDPDHTPKGGKTERRAIQLGLKGEVLKKYATEWIVSITDITDFVKEQFRILQDKGEAELELPREHVYKITDPELSERVEVDSYNSEEYLKDSDVTQSTCTQSQVDLVQSEKRKLSLEEDSTTASCSSNMDLVGLFGEHIIDEVVKKTNDREESLLSVPPTGRRVVCCQLGRNSSDYLGFVI